jgi:hypothetical protein
MNRFSLLIVITSLALLLAACGTSPTQAPVAVSQPESAPQAAATQPPAELVAQPAGRPTLDTTYENALAPRLLLSFGTLKLAETATPLTPEQASQMLMLWQALDTMTKSGNSAAAEVEALLAQIEQTFTPEQITAINAMKLTQTELQAWAQANGIQMGTGTGSGGHGQGQGMSPEARATRQAANGQTGSVPGENGLSAAITQALIAYLQSLK